MVYFLAHYSVWKTSYKHARIRRNKTYFYFFNTTFLQLSCRIPIYIPCFLGLLRHLPNRCFICSGIQWDEIILKPVYVQNVGFTNTGDVEAQGGRTKVHEHGAPWLNYSGTKRKTPRRRAFLRKLTVSQLLKKFPSI
jgi:hypothetical protein